MTDVAAALLGQLADWLAARLPLPALLSVMLQLDTAFPPTAGGQHSSSAAARSLGRAALFTACGAPARSAALLVAAAALACMAAPVGAATAAEDGDAAACAARSARACAVLRAAVEQPAAAALHPALAADEAACALTTALLAAAPLTRHDARTDGGEEAGSACAEGGSVSGEGDAAAALAAGQQLAWETGAAQRTLAVRPSRTAPRPCPRLSRCLADPGSGPGC